MTTGPQPAAAPASAGELYPPPAADLLELVAKCGSPSAEERLEAATLMGRAGAGDTRSAQVAQSRLTQLLLDRSPAVVEAAWNSLGVLAQHDNELAATLGVLSRVCFSTRGEDQHSATFPISARTQPRNLTIEELKSRLREAVAGSGSSEEEVLNRLGRGHDAGARGLEGILDSDDPGVITLQKLGDAISLDLASLLFGGGGVATDVPEAEQKISELVDTRVVSASEVAKYLGLSRQRVYQIAAKGRFGALDDESGEYRFSIREIVEFSLKPKARGGRPRKQSE